MKKIIAVLAAAMMTTAVLGGCGAEATTESGGAPTGELLQFSENTDLPVATMTIAGFGDVVMELYPEQAPKAVENFITHAENGYYDGVEFHRVINDFMIQGGDPTATGAGGQSIWDAPFEDEFSDELYAFRGALCMANAGLGTNGSQFFVVQADSLSMTFEEAVAYHQQSGYGRTEYSDAVQEQYQAVGGTPHLDGMHTVFGQVLEGMDVVDAVAAVATDMNGRPNEQVKIESITIEQ